MRSFAHWGGAQVGFVHLTVVLERIPRLNRTGTNRARTSLSLSLRTGFLDVTCHSLVFVLRFVISDDACSMYNFVLVAGARSGPLFPITAVSFSISLWIYSIVVNVVGERDASV